MTFGNYERKYFAQSDRPQPQDDGSIGAHAGFGIDDSQVHVIRHPDNAGLAQENDVVQKDEKPQE